VSTREQAARESAAEETPETAAGPADAEYHRRTQGALAFAVVSGYGALGACAVLGLAWPCVALLIATEAVDVAVRRTVLTRALLARGQFGLSARGLVRELCIVALALAASWSSHPARFALMLAAVGGLRALYLIGLVPMRRQVGADVITLNVDLAGLRLPPPPPLLMTRQIYDRSHDIGCVGLVAAAVAIAAKSPTAMIVAIAVMAAIWVIADVALAIVIARAKAADSREAVAAAILDRVRAGAPEVMLYFSGTADATFQVNMWLSTLDRLNRPCVVLLRERHTLEQLGPTRWPVVCVPSSITLMSSPLRSVRVALYTVNVGKNIHLLRESGIQHVFIGHGDSDKSGSFSPVSKTFSQIWVAGPVGRERYRKARVGIRDEDIIEVGRPQLEAVSTVVPRLTAALPTVLYAPTWEGWSQDPTHTSLVRGGVPLIEKLLAHRLEIRVIYKPHPLTGTVASRARRADQQIRALLAADNQRRRQQRQAGAVDDPHAPWPSQQPGWAHRVAEGPEPHLYDCFNLADLLVADVSSVLSDFIASEKPFVVPNMTELSEAEFTAKFPSTEAAYLVGPAGEQLAEVLEATLGVAPGADDMAAQRVAAKHALLGPDHPPAMKRFAEAIDLAYEAAVESWPERPIIAFDG
jgi:hypothetical protein